MSSAKPKEASASTAKLVSEVVVDGVTLLKMGIFPIFLRIGTWHSASHRYFSSPIQRKGHSCGSLVCRKHYVQHLQ